MNDQSELRQVYQVYDEALRQDGAFDFDDLLLLPVRLFETRPEVLENYRRRFRWLAVDEYQDTNLVQYRLLRLLVTPQTDLCVIGDPDQAIYGFRGVRRDYFLRFQEDFPGAKTISLYRNYRSTQLILDASGQVISRSPGHKPFDLRSDIIDPARLAVYRAPTDRAEAEYTNLTISLLTSTAFLLTYPNCSKQSANQSPIAGLFCLETFHSMAVFP